MQKIFFFDISNQSKIRMNSVYQTFDDVIKWDVLIWYKSILENDKDKTDEFRKEKNKKPWKRKRCRFTNLNKPFFKRLFICFFHCLEIFFNLKKKKVKLLLKVVKI